MYLFIGDINFSPVYDFDIGFWNCSNGVIFLFFILFPVLFANYYTLLRRLMLTFTFYMLRRLMLTFTFYMLRRLMLAFTFSMLWRLMLTITFYMLRRLMLTIDIFDIFIIFEV